MSHFTVLVVGDDPEGQLAPFQENNMGDCPEEYLEFEDCTAEVVGKYNSGTMEKVVMTDGSYKNKWDEQFQIPKPGGLPFEKDTVIPEHLEIKEVPYKELYDDIDDFASAYYGYNKVDGRYGYTHNPNSKWDWYQLGGRWTGFFKAKFGCEGVSGSPGIMTKPNQDPTRCDQIIAGDIDFDAMINENKIEAARNYDLLLTLFGEIPQITMSWDFFQKKLKAGVIEIDEARKRYWAQPALVRWKEAKDGLKGDTDDETRKKLRNILIWGDLGDYQCSREEYIERAGEKWPCTFAVLWNGEWFEKGSMGWWGCVGNEDKDWPKKFWELIRKLPENTLVSVYDCHI